MYATPQWQKMHGFTCMICTTGTKVFSQEWIEKSLSEIFEACLEIAMGKKEMICTYLLCPAQNITLCNTPAVADSLMKTSHHVIRISGRNASITSYTYYSFDGAHW